MAAIEIEEHDFDPWPGAHFGWKDGASWIPLLTRWLTPYLRKGAMEKLARRPKGDLYIDDPAWIDRVEKVAKEPIEVITSFLADDLAASTLTTYHATRLVDPGVVHREGLKRNDPEALADEARRIVAGDESLAWMRGTLEAKIASFEDRDRDLAQLYVVADDRDFFEHSGHYLLYGSEWIQVLLGWSAHDAMLRRGAPTIFEFGLPLSILHGETRERFAELMLREWGRQQVMGLTAPPSIDFSFHLRRDIPPAWVIGHTHPARIRDPLHNRTRNNPFLDCSSCKAE